ncbi:MAG: YggS family pyridoxal phosphate-dependent enzyme [Candidatus Methylomirabilales bacterium]
MTLDSLKARIDRVREAIAQAAERAGRRGEEVCLIAVAKTFPAEVSRQAVEAGITDLGESRVQEAQAKIEALGSMARWHLVGRLQSNKAKVAVRLFDLIHSVDSLKLAQTLDRYAKAQGKVLRCLVEVNLGGEMSKGGTGPDGLAGLLEGLQGLPALRVEGLMALPPYHPDPEGSRPFFRRLRRLREDMKRRFPELPLHHLSMGMSQDFPIAVEEGATMVRVGTAIFGSRPSPGRVPREPGESSSTDCGLP